MPAMPNPDSLRRVEQVVCKPDSVRCARIRRMTSADGMAVSSSSGVEFMLLFIVDTIVDSRYIVRILDGVTTYYYRILKKTH